jgi:hypothetical protein
MKKRRIYFGLIMIAAMGLVSSVGHAGIGDLLKQADELLNTTKNTNTKNGSSSHLSDSRIDAGLKQALSVGAERAIKLLGSRGGFLNDSSVRIPLPGMLKSVGKGLRAVGQGEYVDQFETTVNRAAEEAIPQTLSVVKKTVTNMTLKDVRGILNGGDSAATKFLQRRAGKSLHAVIKPIVAKATDKSGATAAYKKLMGKADKTLGGFLKTESTDLDDYVTSKTLDGLFLKLAAEEKKIRKDPVARTTDLLQQVFAN